MLDDRFWTTTYDGSIPVDVILRQRPNVRSDVLRAWLLHRYGGIWVDADCIVWRDLRPIAAWLQTKDFVAYRVRLRGRRQLCSALIAARAESEIAAAYWQHIEQQLAPGRKVRTFALGPGLLARVRLIGVERCHFLRTDFVHPIHWKRRAVLTGQDEYTPRPGAWTFMLTHRSLGPLQNATREQLLASDTLIGRLFRRGLTTREPAPATSVSKPATVVDGRREESSPEKAFDVDAHLQAIPYHPVCDRTAAVTCYFNPHAGRARRRCYETFARQFPRIGLELFTAEGSVDDRWEVSDGSNVWRFDLDPNAHLFCKENLLNLIIARLPDRFDRVAWIDGDVVLLSHDYADQLSTALDQHTVVQGFSELRYLNPDGTSETGWRRSLASVNVKDNTRLAYEKSSYPGLVWAASRELLTAVGGLYDRVVTGGGDNAWVAAVYGARDVAYMENWSPRMKADVLRYGERVAPLVPSVGCVPVRGLHLFHGHLKNRQYTERNRMLRRIDFDPQRHLEYAPNGTLRWSAAAPAALRNAVRAYIHGRKEDEV